MCSEVLLQMFNDLEAYGTFIAGTFRRLAVDCKNLCGRLLEKRVISLGCIIFHRNDIWNVNQIFNKVLI